MVYGLYNAQEQHKELQDHAISCNVIAREPAYSNDINQGSAN